jgi:hypothetical protein
MKLLQMLRKQAGQAMVEYSVLVFFLAIPAAVLPLPAPINKPFMQAMLEAYKDYYNSYYYVLNLPFP